MSVPLIIPDHVKLARLSLLSAGYKCDIDDPAFAALMFVSFAYNQTPQFNRAAELQERLSKAERENRRLVGELLREGAKADLLNSGRPYQRLVAPDIDYSTGPVPTYEVFSQAHAASNALIKPCRATWDSVNDTTRRQLLAIALADSRTVKT